jgi:DNA repair exonuclease SbcCD ATPase subunit
MARGRHHVPSHMVTSLTSLSSCCPYLYPPGVQEEQANLTRLKAAEEEKRQQLDDAHQAQLTALRAEHERKEKQQELEQQQQLQQQKVEAVSEKHAACESQANPYDASSMEQKLQQAKMKRDQHKEAHEAAGRRAACFSLLASKDYFGKDGVQMMLYRHMLEQLEARADDYISSLSAGELKLELSFSQDQVDPKVSVRQTSSGLWQPRAVKLLCGGEWRRVGLGLSLAFAEFAKERLNLKCNVMVLDEVRLPTPASITTLCKSAVLIKLRRRCSTLIPKGGLRPLNSSRT